MINTQSLDGAWELFGFPQRGSPVNTPADLAAHTPLPAEVPGEAALALSRAGLLPEDLYKGLHMMKLREYEFYEWWYRKVFTLSSPISLRGGVAPQGRGGCAQHRAVLVFEGVDCVAEYYLNGELFGNSSNALIAHEFDITEFLREGENELVIRLASPIEEAADTADSLPAVTRHHFCCMESLRLRRAPSSYGWDIMCRCVTCGLWRGVRLERRGPHRVTQMFLSTLRIDREADKARLRIFYVFETTALREGLRWRLEGFLGESQVPAFALEKVLWFAAGTDEAELEHPQLWWPAGYGEQPLYRVRLSLWQGEKLLCEKWDTLGVRTIKLERTDITTREKPGKFCFYVNGEPILCKGSNWVPLNAFHSRDAARYEKALGMMQDLGCNILRCWGGNVYEDHAFYDLCDQYGILVWQDFTMACNLYPRDEEFYSQLRIEARKVIQKLRQHPSLALWSGDNECDYNYRSAGLDPNRNFATREVLRLEVENHDGTRDYLPSSPYYAPDFIAGLGQPSEDHLWGPRIYYKDKFYTDSHACFVSEMGFHGCPNRESLEKMFTPENVWPEPRPWRGNAEWHLHASCFTAKEGDPWAGRNAMMANQIAEVFGEIPDDLDEFILASQLVQAEAFKFFIETARLRKWERTGVIWWNLLDGWPQISDAIVDWYGGKKLAYHWVKAAQRPLHLMFAEPEGWHIALVAGNDSLQAREGTYRVRDAHSNETLLEGDFSVPANENKTLARLRVCGGEQRLFLIEWTCDGENCRSHYLHGNPPFGSAGWVRTILKDVYVEAQSCCVSTP
ncbi:MAG: hypothetical protein FWE98_01620 [Oscillospiraceae bacterium]|nr:hypothetical protein [Oscillospiraceae bacterium]